jgi:hypothetical protein
LFVGNGRRYFDGFCYPLSAIRYPLTAESREAMPSLLFRQAGLDTFGEEGYKTESSVKLCDIANLERIIK